MELALGLVSAIVAFAGTVLTCILARRAARKEDRGFLTIFSRLETLMGAILLVLLTVVAWVISLQTMPPFSQGQSLGAGFLIGGAASLLVLLESRMSGLYRRQQQQRTRTLGLIWALFLAGLVASGVYLLFAGYPQHALIGAAIGACMGGIIARLSGRDNFSDVLTDMFAASTALICSGMVLSVIHFGRDIDRMWWPLPALLAVSAAVAVLIGTEVASAIKGKENKGGQVAIASWISAIIVLALCALYSFKIANDWALLKICAISLVAWGLVAAKSMIPAEGPARMESAALVFTLLLGFLVVAFKLWSGLGIAAGLIVGLGVLLPALAAKCDEDDSKDGYKKIITSPGRLIYWAHSAGIAAVLFRVFIEYYRVEVGRGDVRIHYTMIGAMASAIVAMLVMSISSRIRQLALTDRTNDAVEEALTGVGTDALPTQRNIGRAILCTVLNGSLGLFAVVFPLALMFVWDIKAVLGLMFGMIFAVVMLGFMQRCSEDAVISRGVGSGVMLIFGMQLVALQFTGPMMYVDLTRSVRIWIMLGAFVLFLVWFGVISLLSGRKGEKQCSENQTC